MAYNQAHYIYQVYFSSPDHKDSVSTFPDRDFTTIAGTPIGPPATITSPAAARFLGAFLGSAAIWGDQPPAHHQAAGADSTLLVSCLVCLTHRQTAGLGATARQILCPAHALDHDHQVGIAVKGSVAANAR